MNPKRVEGNTWHRAFGEGRDDTCRSSARLNRATSRLATLG